MIPQPTNWGSVSLVTREYYVMIGLVVGFLVEDTMCLGRQGSFLPYIQG